MKVRELIARLHLVNPELDVVVDGYEAGYAEPMYVGLVYLRRDGNAACGVYGRHAEVSLDPTNSEAELLPGSQGYNMVALFVGEGRSFSTEVRAMLAASRRVSI